MAQSKQSLAANAARSLNAIAQRQARLLRKLPREPVAFIEPPQHVCLCGELFRPLGPTQAYCPSCLPLMDDVDEMYLIANEIGETMQRAILYLQREDELLRDGKRYRHRAVLFPEVSYARTMSAVP